MRLSTALSAGALVLAAGQASATKPGLFYDIVPISASTFEVISKVNAGSSLYWCGAGAYALAYLKAGGSQRIYVSRSLGPSQSGSARPAVQFSLQPPAGVSTQPGFGVSVDRVGENLSAAQARSYCENKTIKD